MAYNTEELYNTAIRYINEKNLYFVEDIVAYLGISKATFYDHFPNDSNDLNYLKELLNSNRVDAKVKMRKNWIDSENATLQMGLYKLIATDEERQKLSQSHIDHTTKGEQINVISLGNGVNPNETNN